MIPKYIYEKGKEPTLAQYFGRHADRKRYKVLNTSKQNKNTLRFFRKLQTILKKIHKYRLEKNYKESDKLIQVLRNHFWEIEIYKDVEIIRPRYNFCISNAIIKIEDII